MAKNPSIHKQKAVKDPAGAPPQVVIQKLEVTKRWNRTEQDIPNWRRSIQSAESQIPRRNLLYNLYADIDLDGHVEAVTGKRRDAVTDANWTFVDKEGEEVPAVNELIDSIGFDNLLHAIIDARFWGYSILEPRFWKGTDGKWEMDEGLIPRLFYRPELGVVAYQTIGDEGINIREGIYAKTIMEVGQVKDLGLYVKAAPYYILKRGGLGDYAAFVQTFGNPLVDATWDGYDERQRQQLSDALSGLGAGGNIIRPEGTNVALLQNQARDTGHLHSTFKSDMNNEISKALLGTTETTEASSSSGYAQSKTHGEQDERKHDNDITYVRKNLNSRFIPLLQAAGFDTMGGRFIVQGEETELTKKDIFEMHRDMVVDMGLPIGVEFLYETYGIPRPKDGEEVAGKATMEAIAPDKAKPKPPNQEEEEEDEEGVQLNSPEEEEVVKTIQNKVDDFIKRLQRFFVKAPTSQSVGAVQACGCHHTIPLAASDRIDQEGLIQRIWDAQGKATWDTRLFWQTSDVLLKGFKNAWDKEYQLAEAPGFTYGAEDPALLTAYEQNLFRFTGAKTLAQVQELNRIFRESGSFEEFYQAAKRLTETYNRIWLETEYTTAVLTGEAASTYHRLKKQTDIFPLWIYKTAGDHLVRPEHAALDGLVLRHDDPRWNQIFPPNGWNCRCYIVPRMAHEVDQKTLADSKKRAKAYLGSSQFAKEKATGWAVNRAQLQEVFTASQQYARKFPGQGGKKLDQLQAQDWGLPSYAKAKEVAKGNSPSFSGSATDFMNAAGKDNKLPDYKGRGIRIKEDQFASHITDSVKKRAYRRQYLRAMRETLNEPDEVWQHSLGDTYKGRGKQYRYLKYYQDVTLIVDTAWENGELVLKTWYPLEEKKSVIRDKRRGLLILKK